MNRLLFQDLLSWKQQKKRKPLVLKGVRQTGKTYLLKQFGESEFLRYHYINFEHQQNAAALFASDFNPKRILSDLQFLLNTPIDEKNDLLIFDEIQACPAALTSLKYFAEEMPHLALCCAGSLLGLHLSSASFPVGKVDFLHMRPLCFAEFLEANEEKQALDQLNLCTIHDSLSAIAHERLWQQFKIYLITGGLPEVVQIYIDNKKDLYTALMKVREKQEQLIYGYYADIAKHSGKVNAMHIDRVWRSIPSQLAQVQEGHSKRFQFKNIVPGIDRYQRLANVIDWLASAELIIHVPIVKHVECPLMAYEKESFFKLYLFDIGILGALSNLSPKAILDYDYGTYKGYFAENFLAQEFFAKGITNLHSWQDNRAEVEFLYIKGNAIIPMEVKAGKVTHHQSLHKYTKKYKPTYRVVFSAKPLHVDLKNHYHQYPIYMAYWFPLKDSHG